MPIDLVIFDLGRVLIRLCDGWAHACDVAGVDRPGEMDRTNEAKLMEFVYASEVGDLDLHGFATAISLLIRIPVEHVKALSNAYLLGTYPGAIELIDELNALGLMTACLSNTNENHWRLICDPTNANYLPPAKFAHAFASHLVGMRKPDARIYEHVERVTGISPGGIVFFDDLAENIAAANARGWYGYQIEIGPDPIAQMRRHLVGIGVAVG